MVQRVYRQIKEVDADASVTIATSKTQVSSIHNQLNNSVGICVEPCRRDTFPAMHWQQPTCTTSRVSALMRLSSSVPVDPYVNNDYFAALKHCPSWPGRGTRTSP